MAPDVASNTSVITLKVINNTITSTPVRELPHLIPPISIQLQSCGDLLATEDSTSASETAIAVHKFKTRLSVLIQDRTIEGRWAAVVLIKAAVEVGGWPVLQTCGPWVRGLIAILNKPDPPCSKKFCIVTLTRIFMLTREHPSLLRDITTPSLPPFITACLNHFQSTAVKWSVQKTAMQEALLECMLESFTRLVLRHPTIFRSFTSQIRGLLGGIIGATSAEGLDRCSSASLDVKELASQLFVQLHHCAPKSGSTDEWDEYANTVVRAGHECADQIFRATIESWTSIDGRSSAMPSGVISNEPKGDKHDFIQLPAWTGLPAGINRMVQLLRLLRHYIATKATFVVHLPVGVILDLVTRILAVVPPQTTRWSDFEIVRTEISKQERDLLWVLLPDVHVAAIDIIRILVQRLGKTSTPTCNLLLDQLVWVYVAERANLDIRTSVYLATTEIMCLIGPSLISAVVQNLDELILGCAADAAHSPDSFEEERSHNPKKPDMEKVIKQDAALRPKSQSGSNQTRPLGLLSAARQLLTTLLEDLPARSTPTLIRAEMERAAILASDVNAMIAATLNPGRSAILPVLAQIAPDHPVVEAVIRPRMPVVQATVIANGYGAEDEENVDTPLSDPLALLDRAIAEEPQRPERLRSPAEERPMFRIQETRPAAQQGLAGTPTVQQNEAPPPVENPSAFLSAPTKRSLSTSGEPDRLAKQIRRESQHNVSVAQDTSTTAQATAATRNSPVFDPVESVSHSGADRDDLVMAADAEPLQKLTAAALTEPVPQRHDEGEEDSDDEDFEVPPLVFKADSEDE